MVPVSAIVPDETAVCVGAGEDISFDIELNRRGMFVVCVDATPRAKQQVAEVWHTSLSGKPVGTGRLKTAYV